MRLTTKFQIASKSKWELQGLYRVIFNKLADPEMSKSQRQNALFLLRHINRQLGLFP